MASSSSTREEPSTSSVVANVSTLVSTEAKMIVATGRGHCQQLKDMMSKEDPSTIVVVMASSNQTPTPPKPRSPVMDPGLLAAACSGSWQKLQSFLNERGRQASSDGATGSSAMQPAFGDEEALLRETFLEGVTTEGDTFLHVMATNSDGENLNEDCRCPICRKAVSLLVVQNNNEDTPMHCAARAAKFKMVSLLIDLARVKDYNVNTVRALLRIENKSKWTVLHEAVRSGNNDIVKLLMTYDKQLASFPKDDASPLYPAILLENETIAKILYELSGGVLSYSGPNGQNALHAAVLRGKGLVAGLKARQEMEAHLQGPYDPPDGRLWPQTTATDRATYPAQVDVTSPKASPGGKHVSLAMLERSEAVVQSPVSILDSAALASPLALVG